MWLAVSWSSELRLHAVGVVDVSWLLEVFECVRERYPKWFVVLQIYVKDSHIFPKNDGGMLHSRLCFAWFDAERKLDDGEAKLPFLF